MIKLKIRITIFVLLGLVLGIQSARLILLGKQASWTPGKYALKSKGNPQAVVKVLEYTDFQCPACSTGNLLLKSYFQKDAPRIYIEYHHFPLDMHPRAMSVAIAAECAAQQKRFWEFHDLAFSRQNLLRETINLPARLSEMADEVRLNRKVFDKCLADPAMAQAVAKQRDEGKALKISATPTYFVNGQMLVGTKALAKELEKQLGGLIWGL